MLKDIIDEYISGSTNIIEFTIKYHNYYQRNPECSLIVSMAANRSLDGLSGAALEAAEDVIRHEMANHAIWTPIYSAECIRNESAFPEPKRSRVQKIWLDHIIECTKSKDENIKMMAVTAMGMVGPTKKRPGFLTTANTDKIKIDHASVRNEIVTKADDQRRREGKQPRPNPALVQVGSPPQPRK